MLPSGPPILFETMVFQGKEILDMQRYSTWEEAQAGHAEWIDRCKNHKGELGNFID